MGVNCSGSSWPTSLEHAKIRAKEKEREKKIEMNKHTLQKLAAIKRELSQRMISFILGGV